MLWVLRYPWCILISQATLLMYALSTPLPRGALVRPPSSGLGDMHACPRQSDQFNVSMHVLGDAVSGYHFRFADNVCSNQGLNCDDGLLV
jgi:hypothetical protein